MSLDGKQQAISALGLGLIGLDLWKGRARHDLGAVLQEKAPASAIQAAHADVVGIAAELLFVGGLVLLAGMSDQAGTAGVAILLALFVLWLMTHTAGGQFTGSNVQQAPTAPASTAGNVAGTVPV